MFTEHDINRLLVKREVTISGGSMSSIIGGIVGALVGLALSIWAAIAFWGAVVVPAVPVGEWNGLIKIVVAFFMFWLFGGLVVFFSIFCGAITASLTGYMTK